MNLQSNEPPTQVDPPLRLCSCGQHPVRMAGQRYCVECNKAAQGQWRAKVRAARNSPESIEARQQQRLAEVNRKLAAYDSRFSDSRETGAGAA